MTLDGSIGNTIGLVLAFVVGTIACARMVRLIIDDDYPPVVWLRERYVEKVGERWGMIVECPWCAAPYVVVVDLVWAWTTGLHWTWWFGNLLAAVSWLVAYLNLRDIPPEAR